MKAREYHVSVNGRLIKEARTISEATKAVSASLSDMTIDVDERRTITIRVGPIKYKDMNDYRKKEKQP